MKVYSMMVVCMYEEDPAWKTHDMCVYLFFCFQLTQNRPCIGVCMMMMKTIL
jgi:hypothetical protein